MIQVPGSHVYIDIEIDGQRLSEDFVKQNSIEIFAFRIALTAGFALPLFSMIMGSTNLTYLNKFKSGFVYLSDGRPVQALADRMFEAERLFGQKDDYQEMCNNANRMICEELNWDNIADMDMKELYNKKK